mmetsp:Transcript_19629/g.63759  ORF Transcript_19629/g.63759 Transcript_19629/m.63759 type:complete len:248 (+) Transcript_19629:1248-1991(+)
MPSLRRRKLPIPTPGFSRRRLWRASGATSPIDGSLATQSPSWPSSRLGMRRSRRGCGKGSFGISFCPSSPPPSRNGTLCASRCRSTSGCTRGYRCSGTTSSRSTRRSVTSWRRACERGITRTTRRASCSRHGAASLASGSGRTSSGGASSRSSRSPCSSSSSTPRSSSCSRSSASWRGRRSSSRRTSSLRSSRRTSSQSGTTRSRRGSSPTQTLKRCPRGTSAGRTSLARTSKRTSACGGTSRQRSI